jgi:hypothetical protein
MPCCSLCAVSKHDKHDTTYKVQVMTYTHGANGGMNGRQVLVLQTQLTPYFMF